LPCLDKTHVYTADPKTFGKEKRAAVLLIWAMVGLLEHIDFKHTFDIEKQLEESIKTY